MQTLYSYKKAVHPSVRPSIRLSGKRVNCDKMEKDMSKFLYHT